MNNSNFQEFDNDNGFDLRTEFFKYLFFWKYILISTIFCLFVAYAYVRYTPKIYEANAKIQILDEKQRSIEMPSAEDLFSNSKINLENEIEILTSTPILEQVIKNLYLNIYIEVEGDIMSSHALSFPFDIVSKINFDTLKSTSSYNLKLEENNLIVKNLRNNKKNIFSAMSSIGVNHDLPFEITNVDLKTWDDNSYNLFLIPNHDLISSLKKKINVSQVGNQSDIISLTFQHTKVQYCKNVLNEFIDVFNQDGIRDRQLIHKRTIDFVNDRYVFLSSELDSIEIDKKTFKINNDLVDLNANSIISLEKNSQSEENIFQNENEIYIITNLLEELSKLDFELLPTNIGIENIKINSLIQSYNNSILELRKLISSAGPNNPSVKNLNSLVSDMRANIEFSLNNHLEQLKIINSKLLNRLNRIEDKIAVIPFHEKQLRAIERNQQIKESLYLFLLKRGEEAQVSYAITEPTVKVVEYAISNNLPVYPKTKVIYLLALFIGIFFPIGIIYITFLFDNKVHSREDLEKFSLNVLGEIPFFDLNESDKVFTNPDDRSIISESFRMLMSNVRYLQKIDSKSNVILLTSSIKGEGKTLNALNLALSFSSVGEKVLLIGCDLRNPQLHKYINHDKNVPGLVDFLVDNKIEWRKNILNPFETQSLDILLSGPLPPNPLNLINNGNLDILLKDARKTYDHIIIDSAPTLLVADSQYLIKKSDILIFLTRCNVTDREVLYHIKKISDETNTNVGVILNGVGQKNSYGYSYGYRYGYGYNYKYSYNYGYGYGYSSDDEKS